MATETYTNWESVRESVASGLHVAASALDARWDTICSRATQDAAAEIKRLLVLKGYTPAQIAGSDDARIWNDRLGAFFAFTRGTALGSYDLKSVEWLDCREEMKEAAALVIGGVATGPANGNSDVGGITSGQIDAAIDFLDPEETTGRKWGAGTNWTW